MNVLASLAALLLVAGPPPAIPAPDDGEWSNPVPVNIEVWATRTLADYPRQALRRGWEGTVRISLVIDTEGRVSQCAVIGSSGHPVLDEAACAGARRYARFKPATDPDGNPVEGGFMTAIGFTIP